MSSAQRLPTAETDLKPWGRGVHGATPPGINVPCERTSPLTASEVGEVVEIIAAGRIGRHAATLPERLRTRDWGSVMRVLLGLEARLPGTPAGWKIGAASEQVRQAELIPEPTPGRLYTEAVSGSPARLGPEYFINYRNVECEFAFRLGADLPVRDRPYTEADARAAVDCMLPALEIGDMVFLDWYGASGYYGPCLDNGGGAAFVHGAAFRDWADYDLSAANIDVSFNGTPLKSGQGRAAMGHPITSLTWMVNWLQDRGRPLLAGEIISTGTCTGHCFAAVGDTVRADFGPFGAVEVTFTAGAPGGGRDADQ